MIKHHPIYSEAYYLTREILLLSAKMPKYHRPTLGSRLEQTSLDLVVMLRRELLKKGAHNMDPMSDRVDDLKVLTQLAHDVEAMSHHSFEALVTSSEKIGKMICGMKKQPKPVPT